MSRHSMTRVTAIGLAIVALAAPAVAQSNPLAASRAGAPLTASPAAPAVGSDTAGVPQATCFWFGPMGMMTPATNLAYPDEGAWYWGARFRLPPGSVLRLAGRFPNARFMSVNSYGLVDGVEHAAVDSLEDTEIRPDPGSTNPYLVGADRYAPNRSYRITVPAADLGPRGRNFLGVPDTNAGAVQELIYRVYLPDGKADRRVRSLPRPELALADGRVLTGRSLCDAVNDTQRYFTFQTMPPALYRSLVNTPGGDPAVNSAFDPPRWEKFFNTPLALSIYAVGTDLSDLRLKDLGFGEAGGYYDNRAVRYSVAPINAAHGDVLVLRGKLPTTPRTGPGVRTMRGGQMRYWSICQNGSPVETNAIDCVSDAEVRPLLGKHRRYTVVVSNRADRPDNARRQCNAAWLDWGQQRDILGRRSGTLLLRNLDSEPGFARSLQKVTLDDIDVTSIRNRPETKVMGPYQPKGEYLSTGQFENRGCARGGAPGRG